MEYGIFNAEGYLTRQIYSLDEANRVLAHPLFVEDPTAYVDTFCPDHEDQPSKSGDEVSS